MERVMNSLIFNASSLLFKQGAIVCHQHSRAGNNHWWLSPALLGPCSVRRYGIFREGGTRVQSRYQNQAEVDYAKYEETARNKRAERAKEKNFNYGRPGTSVLEAQYQLLTEDELKPNLRSHPYRRMIVPWKSKEELANHLLQNIVYHSGGVLAVNKPYGVGVSNVQEVKHYKRELEERQGKFDWHNPPKAKEPEPPAIFSLYHARGVSISNYTIEDVLPILRRKLGLPSLVISKSTEKFTSGVAVFAENEEVESRLKSCYKSAKAQKIKPASYLVISTLIPQLENGHLYETVGISLQNVEIKGRSLELPIIERNFSKTRMKHKRDIVPTQTEVTVHSSNSVLNVCLTEIQTTVTRSHFLRIYSNDLLMPILGDHLFSNRIQTMMEVPILVNPLSIEPGTCHQKLSKDVLANLAMSQRDDSIIIPFHAHQAWYTVPHFFGKRKHLIITAPPPNYFQWTCSKLRLNLEKAMQSPRPELTNETEAKSKSKSKQPAETDPIFLDLNL